MREYCSLFLKMCVFSLGWNMWHWTLLDIWVQNIFSACFCIIWVCWIQIHVCLLTFNLWCHSPSNTQNKNGHQNHICSIFFYILLHDFWFMHDLELINLCLMFCCQNDLYLTFKFKMVTTNTQIKAVFIHVNYNHKQHLFNGKLKKIDYNTAD